MDLFLFIKCILLLLNLVTVSHLMFQTQASEFQYCDNVGNYPVTVSGVETSPDPLITLEPASFGIFALTKQNFSDGKLEVSFYYFWYLPIYWETHVLCSHIHPLGCPVTTGCFLLQLDQHFPSYAQPGPYTIEIKMFDHNEKLLTCLHFYTSWWSFIPGTARLHQVKRNG